MKHTVMGKYGTHQIIANSESVRCGSMICKKCKNEIKESYLIVEHYNSKRGNEDDYNELFCFECSKNRKAWKDYYNEIERSKKKQVIEHKKNIIKGIEIIKESSWIEFTTDEYGKTCIVIY